MNFDIYNHLDENQFFRNLYIKNTQSYSQFAATLPAINNNNFQQQQQQHQQQLVHEKREYCYGLGQRSPNVPFAFNKLTNQSTNCFDCLEYDIPIIKNEESNVISAFDYIFTDFFRENTLKLTNGSYKCQIDSLKFNSEKEMIEHMRIDHKPMILQMVSLLSADDETNYLGNFFTKLMYSDTFYSIHPAKTPVSYESLLEYPSVLAPNLPLLKDVSSSTASGKDGGKPAKAKKSKKSKKAKLKPKTTIQSQFPKDELAELSRSLFGTPKSTYDNITISNAKKVQDQIQLNKGETEEARMKKEQSIFNDIIAKIQSSMLSEADMVAAAKEKAEEQMLLEEIADIIIDEVVEELVTKVSKKISADDKKKRAKEAEKEKERLKEQQKRERELAKEKEREAKEQQLKLEKQQQQLLQQQQQQQKQNEELLHRAVNEIVDELLSEIVGEECVEIASQAYHEHLQWKEHQKQQSIKEKKSKLNIKSTTTTTTSPTLIQKQQQQQQQDEKPKVRESLTKESVVAGLNVVQAQKQFRQQQQAQLLLQQQQAQSPSFVAGEEEEDDSHTHISTSPLTLLNSTSPLQSGVSTATSYAHALKPSATTSPTNPQQAQQQQRLQQQQQMEYQQLLQRQLQQQQQLLLQQQQQQLKQQSIYQQNTSTDFQPMSVPKSPINMSPVIGSGSQGFDTNNASSSIIAYLQQINFKPELTLLCRTASSKSALDVFNYLGTSCRIAYNDQMIPKIQQLIFDREFSTFLVQFESLVDLENGVTIVSFPGSPFVLTRIYHQPTSIVANVPAVTPSKSPVLATSVGNTSPSTSANLYQNYSPTGISRIGSIGSPTNSTIEVDSNYSSGSGSLRSTSPNTLHSLSQMLNTQNDEQIPWDNRPLKTNMFSDKQRIVTPPISGFNSNNTGGSYFNGSSHSSSSPFSSSSANYFQSPSLPSISAPNNVNNNNMTSIFNTNSSNNMNSMSIGNQLNNSISSESSFFTYSDSLGLFSNAVFPPTSSSASTNNSNPSILHNLHQQQQQQQQLQQPQNNIDIYNSYLFK